MRLASRIIEQRVKKQCGLAGLCFRGRMALDLRLSRVRTDVAAMGQDCNYQLGRKRGNLKKIIITLLKWPVFNDSMYIGQQFLRCRVEYQVVAG